MTSAAEVLRLIADHVDHHGLGHTIQGIRLWPGEQPAVQVRSEILEAAITAWVSTLDSPVVSIATGTSLHLFAHGLIGGVEIEVTGVVFDSRADALRQAFGVVTPARTRVIDAGMLASVAARKAA